MFAAALIQAPPLLPVAEEAAQPSKTTRQNYALKLRENFIDRVFAHQRWHELGIEPRSFQALIRFHTARNWLLVAHSERHDRELGDSWRI
jgi:hypothetical protein